MKTLKGAVTHWNGVHGVVCGVDGHDYFIHECDLLYPVVVGSVVMFDLPFAYCAVRVRPVPIIDTRRRDLLPRP